MAEDTKLILRTNAKEYYISVYLGWPNMASDEATENKLYAIIRFSDGTMHLMLSCSYYAAHTIRGIMCHDNIALLTTRMSNVCAKDKDGTLWLTDECVVKILQDHLYGRLTG